MVKSRIVDVLGVAFIWLALFGLIHQQLTTNDVWFNWAQFWHHEGPIACAAVAGVALMIGKRFGRG